MVAGRRRYPVYFLATFLALLKTSLLLANGEAFDYPSIAKPPGTWINNVSNYSWDSGWLTLQPILVNGDFVCGFHCKVEQNNTCLFAISIFNFTSISDMNSQIVWSANRSNPVGRGAQLQLSQQGDLTLQNVDSTLICSSVKPPFPYTNIISDSSWKSEELILEPIFVNGNFVCGFHCKLEENNTCLFAISIFHFESNYWTNLKMVWSANRNDPVGGGAKLQLSQQGDLTLQDVNDTLVWSTKTAGKSVSGLKLTDQGNLLLFDGNNETVWQSFDHPTDCLVLGQSIVSGQKLKSNSSTTEWSEGLFSFLIDNDGFFVASAESDASLVYYLSPGSQLKSKTGQFYAKFTNTSLGASLSPGLGVSFIQLGSDGHLRSFGWVESEWKEVDLFENQVGSCDYPLACGKYGICLAGRCSCPEQDENETVHFKPIDPFQPELGCSPSVPLITCKSRLLEIKNVSSSTLLQSNNYHKTDIESCKQTCLNDCSCKYAAFQNNGFNTSTGWCSFGSEALSFKREVDTYYNPSVFLKVSSSTEHIPQKDLPSPRKRRQNVGLILGSTLGATFSVLLICTLLLLQIKKDPKDVEEDYLGHISGTSTRFSYEELKDITNNFSNKLGEGGFGCVFQGTLPGSTQVAVKIGWVLC
ncbi:hypothetical protein SLEP1_g39825 [Rubroshorea leprosula]|uniref:Uncharacterized protein n=1 Tax=Rubroshorea leprosula TaxID=152421 RepID=A0AAV5L1N8_9ROSI|nr:hypothetical protein SLEP1_g39825 [Rubroshorea leprosula]